MEHQTEFGIGLVAIWAAYGSYGLRSGQVQKAAPSALSLLGQMRQALCDSPVMPKCLG